MAFAVPLTLFGVALALRVLDIFVLRLDERWGEILLSKALGFAAVAAYLVHAGRSLAAIGLHGGSFLRVCGIGGSGAALALCLAYLAVVVSGDASRVVFSAVDPKTGAAGGVAFAVWLVFGNAINAFMEEALFRGLMLRHFRSRLGRWPALGFAAALFAAWHWVWPLKAWLLDRAAGQDALFEALSLTIATFVAGLVYGYMYLRTNSLWCPWLAHFVNNTTFNLVFVTTDSGVRSPTEIALFGPTYLVLLLALIPWTAWAARRSRLSEIRPW